MTVAATSVASTAGPTDDRVEIDGREPDRARGHHRHRGRAAPRGAVALVRSALLNLAAAGGGTCIALLVLATALHISLIMFGTGSMSPAIPAGSLAMVREIPASQARVGEVVTVDRDGLPPITHRVVSARPAAGGETLLTLKGDANAEPDPAPYSARTVRLVIWSAPDLARVVVWLDSPVVVGSASLAVAALVCWTLWPVRRRGGRQ